MSVLKAFLTDVKELTQQAKDSIVQALQDDSVPTINSPLVGNIYRHHLGAYYELLHVTNENTTKPGFVTTAVYKCKGTGVVYSRPWEEFQSKFILIKQ